MPDAAVSEPKESIKVNRADYHSVQPYMIVKGAAEALDFYKKAFGATERMRVNFKDRIGHAEIQIGDSCVMMADEFPEIGAHGPEHFGGTPVSLMVYLDGVDEVYAQALAAGAVSERAPADQPHGVRMCGVRDPFGHRWYLASFL
jgi:PhnB protein